MWGFGFGFGILVVLLARGVECVWVFGLCAVSLRRRDVSATSGGYWRHQSRSPIALAAGTASH